MDIYNYLKKDHRKVSDMLDEMLQIRSYGRRERLLNAIRHELLLHAETEQETFYAALEDEELTEDRIEEAKEEHQEIKDYLNKLSRIPVDSEKWLVTFGEFKHAVEHHVKEEEETIFEKARKILDSSEEKQLVRDMEELKEQRIRKSA